MKRTYRSKKDMAGALDHRDMIQNVDEKSSIFSAFYIQNIKQTKRELSSVGSSNNFGTISNKVRKKKYVKRIIKEVETVKEDQNMSQSTYLTPDKSFRVNKVYDPFDMLLMSSPASRQDEGKGEIKENIPKRIGKTYVKKKTKLKKLNYSSSNSFDSDKENMSNPTNTTDIHTHKLVVERAPSGSPNYFDESINKIVNNISLYNYKNKNNTFNTSYKNTRHRLTRNLNSPILQKSPLCSTPFKEKYRGKSIYNFSPITINNSPNYDIVKEDNKSNNSIVLVHNKTPNLTDQTSPITSRSKDITIKELSYATDIDKTLEQNDSKVDTIIREEILNIDSIKNVPNSQLFEREGSIVYSFKDDNIQKDSFEVDSIKIDSIEGDIDDNIQKDLFEDNSIKKDLTEGNDFIDKEQSIDENSIKNNSVQDISINKDEITKNSFEEEVHKVNSFEEEEEVHEAHSFREESETESLVENSVIEQTTLQTTELEPFLGFSINQNKSLIDYNDYLLNLKDTGNELEFEEENSVKSSPNISADTKSSLDSSELDSDKESMYDTCNSESYETDNPTQSRIPVVAIERMNDSVFMKYYEKMNEKDNTEKIYVDNENATEDEFASISNKSSISDNSLSTEPEIIENKAIEIVITDSSTTEDLISSADDQHSSDEEKCISFVTTRRKNDYTNDSMFIFDNSYASSSTDCDKTVLSNKLERQSALDASIMENEPKITADDKEISRITVRKSSRVTQAEKTEIDISETTLTDINEENDIHVSNNENHLDNSAKALNVNNRAKSLALRNNFSISERESSRFDDGKPGIVLKPGKKWERSLSIYKRMTMMNDCFDVSILEEESQNKGRKYRQSVITTMEMQDSHNESINSRRSTFVSKPSRPTVKFVIDPNVSRVSLNSSTVYDDLKPAEGFLHEECDDTVIELSKLSLVDSEHEVTVLETFHDTDRFTTARDYVLRRCNQTEPILFDECYPEPLLKNCHKIGEGVYGEVFLWRGRDARARVMKIVPIAGHVKVNGEEQKDYHEIISEIVIAMELSALRAPIADIDRLLDEGKDIDTLDLHAVENATDVFNEVLAVRCVYGPYPSRLLDLWDLYDECKGSENDNPASLPVDQQYIVLELANAGQDLESYQFNNAQQAYALFQQIAFGLAVGEEAFQFEHRDLHWGNVLIAQTDQEYATFVLRNRVYRVLRCGVAGTIIDYSLSRVSVGRARQHALLYNDLAHDEQLFDAVGDYQFEVYRLMRDKLGNDWKNFEPYTNILWLHYTVDKMITALRYKRTNTKIHKQYIEKLKGIKERILDYGSATLFVLTDNV